MDTGGLEPSKQTSSLWGLLFDSIAADERRFGSFPGAELEGRHCVFVVGHCGLSFCTRGKNIRTD